MYPDQVETIFTGPDPDAVGFIKEVFRKKSVIALAVLHVLLFAAQAAAAVFFMQTMYLSAETAEIRSVTIPVTWIALFTLAVILVLTVAGYLAAFAKSRDLSPDVTPKTGLNLLFAAWLIALIGSVIAAVLTFFVVYIGFVLSSPVMQSLSEGVLVAIGAVICVTFCFITLFSPTARLRWLVGVRKTQSGSFPTMQGAKAYSVISVISAVFDGVLFLAMLFLSLLLTFAPYPDYLRDALLPALYALTAAAICGMVIRIIGSSLPKAYRSLALIYRESHTDYGYGYGDGFSSEDDLAYYHAERQAQLPKYCPYCGAVGKQGDKFCGTCGNYIQ